MHTCKYVYICVITSMMAPLLATNAAEARQRRDTVAKGRERDGSVGTRVEADDDDAPQVR